MHMNYLHSMKIFLIIIRGYIRRIFGYSPIFEYPNTKYSQYPLDIREYPQIPITIHRSCNILILFNIKHYFITTIKDNFYFQRIFYIIQVFFKLFVQKELD